MAKSPDKVPPSTDKSSLYLIFGDEFLVKEEVRKLVERVLPDELRATNLIVLDGSATDMGGLSSILFTPSLFGGERVIVVEQTAVFAGKSDHGKMAAKAMDAWKSGKRRASLSAMAQVLNAAGIDRGQISSGTDWIGEILGQGASADDLNVMTAVAQALIEEGGAIKGGTDEDTLAELIRSPFPEGTVLVFTSEAVERRKKIFKTVTERGTLLECVAKEQKYGSGLDRSFFDTHVRDALQKKGKAISPQALEVMFSKSGKELRRLHAELDKLVAFAGERPEITVTDVEEVFTGFHEAGFFDLTNALRSADVTRCLPALHENLEIADSPLQTLGLIAAEVRRLMMARELLFTVFRSAWKSTMPYNAFVPVVGKIRQDHPELTRKSKFALLSMSDYPLYLLLREAQKFSMEKLITVMEAILEADIMFKSTRVGSRSPRSILENVVLCLCKAGKR